MLKEAFFAVAASREPKMDRVRPAMLIAALVVDVGRRLPRRCGSAVPPSAVPASVKTYCTFLLLAALLTDSKTR